MRCSSHGSITSEGGGARVPLNPGRAPQPAPSNVSKTGRGLWVGSLILGVL